ncbi:hypothetical protein [Rubrivirga sp. IMCC43871]|uniref:hypothetical protein n=1 Tax=Rubrivirga sp. IMCC43871 TaxID=3391575 RepID=UPI00398FB3AA
MPDHTILYRMPRAAFDSYARAYYRDTESPLPRTGASERLDLLPTPDLDVWRLDGYAIRRRLFSPWQEPVMRALGAAWPDGALHTVGARALTTAIRATPMAYRQAVDGGTSGFWPPAHVQRVAAEIEVPLPDAVAARDSLFRVRADISAELDPLVERFGPAQTVVDSSYEAIQAFDRFDLRTFVRAASRAVVAFDTLMSTPRTSPQDSEPPTPCPTSFDWQRLEGAAEFVDGTLAALDRWIEGGASQQVADLQAFYRRAAAAGEYVVSVRAAR